MTYGLGKNAGHRAINRARRPGDVDSQSIGVDGVVRPGSAGIPSLYVPGAEKDSQVIAGYIRHRRLSLERALTLGYLQGRRLGRASRGSIPGGVAAGVFLDQLPGPSQGGRIRHVLQLIAHGVQLAHIDG